MVDHPPPLPRARGPVSAALLTSVVPMARYARAFRRLGVDGNEFYDLHVAADAHHEVLAADELATGLIVDEPELLDDLFFGVHAVSNAERRLTEHLFTCWDGGDTSLLRPLRHDRELALTA